MRGQNSEKSISALAALLLFGVFAVGVLSVLLSGAGTYRRLTSRDRLAYDSRTCAQYVATKVRQAPAPDAVLLSAFGDGDALVIAEELDGVEYWTRVYCYDGWLMELFAAAGGSFAPEDGEKIMELQSLTLEQAEGLLSIVIVDGGGTRTEQTLLLRGGEGAGP